jgi:hypothetical protein
MKPETPWLDRALVWGAGGVFIAVNLCAAMIGRDLQRQFELQADQEMFAEDRVVCERLQAPPGSARFLSCIVELDGVRQRARERSDAQDLDLL